MGKLVEHTDFGQRKRTLIRFFAQDADLASVEAIELPYGCDALIELIHKYLLIALVNYIS
jgi:hypothetical protein